MADGKLRSLFAKLIVDDEEKMTEYYSKVYGLQELARVAGDVDSDGLGEPLVPRITAGACSAGARFRVVWRQ